MMVKENLKIRDGFNLLIIILIMPFLCFSQNNIDNKIRGVKKQLKGILLEKGLKSNFSVKIYKKKGEVFEIAKLADEKEIVIFNLKSKTENYFFVYNIESECFLILDDTNFSLEKILIEKFNVCEDW